jgi:hypothetical protein
MSISEFQSLHLVEGQLAVEVVDWVFGQRAVAAINAPHDLMHHRPQPLQ